MVNSKLILASCMLSMACGANFQQQSSKEVRSEIATTAKPKQELARKVLMEIGVAQKSVMHHVNLKLLFQI
ncbi:hypothetical protein RIVM261_051590 [Rivularia sp. IAM M-261]|nr:hypothetical protein CAL7716_004900 [Calothrix sp. PCC 7716]GJD20203.1 hypothetical protein RIVM261_051590 [Rivularia sp. IAM M-261]